MMRGMRRHRWLSMWTYLKECRRRQSGVYDYGESLDEEVLMLDSEPEDDLPEEGGSQLALLGRLVNIFRGMREIGWTRKARRVTGGLHGYYGEVTRAGGGDRL